MQKIIEKTSYVIGFRQSNEQRLNALLFVVSLLRSYFPELEIVVVEQDETPKLQIDKSLGVRQVFIQDGGTFNHSRCYNYGAQNSRKAFLIFATADIFLSKEDFCTCFALSERFEALTPNRTKLLNVVVTDPKVYAFDILNNQPLFTFAGGILFMQRPAFEKAGGWDERFEGWGGEDNAMSHVIYNKMTSKTLYMPMYHIDHPRGKKDGKSQDKYAANRKLMEEISTFHGDALDRYCDFLRFENGFENRVQEDAGRKPKFVFAVTTYNRVGYLKACISSFLETKNPDYDWQIIIADDGSTDETIEYLNELETHHGAFVIRNKRVDIVRQANTILKKLDGLDFHLCFKCDDDIVFLGKGWDDLYWETIQRTGYDHLIFYDTLWQPYHNLDRPICRGGLVAHCEADNIQGAFYTITKRVLRDVGYFDEQQFGRRGLEHSDYTFRCCRAGFNVLAHPFDVVGSNDLLRLQSENYRPSVTSRYKATENPSSVLAFKKEIVKSERKHIPYNENFYSLDTSEPTSQYSSSNPKPLKKASMAARFRRADATYYPGRGISGFLGFLLKRFYNICLDLRLYFIPAGMKAFGRILNKLGADLINIED